MKATTISSPTFLKAPVRPTRLERLARRIVHSRLEKLRIGSLTISDNGVVSVYGSKDASENGQLAADLQIHHPSFFSDIAFGGSIGAGESYMQGHWSSSDLTRLLRL